MIKTLHLRNFKCFASQSFLLGNLTLLTGLNGAGKSTVLQSLLLLRQSKLDGLLDRTGLSLNGSLVQLGTARDIFYEDAEKDDFSFRLELDDHSSGDWVFRYDRKSDVVRRKSGKTPKELYQSSLFTDGFHYLQAERVGPRVGSSMSDYQVLQKHQLGPHGEYTAHFLAAYGEQPLPLLELAHSASEGRTLRSQVEAWMSEVSPGVQIDVTTNPDLDLVNLRYRFVRARDVSNYYRPTNVGFGISYTLHVLVALLSSKPGTLLLLENPEAHLHPRGQSQLGGLIAQAAQAGVQILVETHSDHILNGIRVAVHDNLLSHENLKLYYLTRQADANAAVVIEPKMDRHGRIDQWPDGFFDEWEKRLEQLLD